MEQERVNPRPGRNIGIMLLLVTLATVAGYAGYLLGIKNSPNQKTAEPMAVNSNSLKLGPESIIQNQQATAVGTITGVQNKFVRVKADNGESTLLRLGPQFYVYTPDATSSASPPKSSQSEQDIIPDRKAIVTLTLSGTEYVVTSINYLPK